MGIRWRFAMPLLSTLAALVIIVHSAEENLDRERRYELRPRVLDTRPSDNEQPWRVVRSEQTMQHDTPPLDTWSDDSQDEPPVRRRLGRKRKRRPPSPSSEETDPIPAILKTEDHETEETNIENREQTPGKRRKKLRPNRWTEESTETTRPVRRRGQRRKRPSQENWPELSEFGSYPRNKKIVESSNRDREQAELDDDDIGYQRYSHRSYDNGDDGAYEEISPHNRKQESEPRFVIADENGQHYKRPNEDKSLSEFSMEVMGYRENTTVDTDEHDYKEHRGKVDIKSPELTNTMEDDKEHGPIDALTLKDILKRSNGTSLSEILQQHNLTLADLLNGKENAIAVLKKEKSLQDSKKSIKETFANSEKNQKIIDENIRLSAPLENIEKKSISEQDRSEKVKTKDDSFVDKNNKSNKIPNINDLLSNVQNISKQEEENITSIEQDTISSPLNIPEKVPKRNSTAAPKLEPRTSGMLARRRFPGVIRRKLRMRPLVNNTYKSQINRDLIAMSARRYVHHNRRNITKAKEWKDMVPLMVKINTTEENKENSSVITTANPEETTTLDSDENTETTISYEPTTVTSDIENEKENVVKETTTISVEILATELDSTVTEKVFVTRPPISQSSGRRQSYNNRLKKKRMRQKLSTTEAPQDDIMKNLLELGNLVSSSEFIARTQLPKTTIPDDYTETVTELEDFLTTQTVRKGNMRSTSPATRNNIKSTIVTKSPVLSATEETAKFEIEEILNDTRSSAKLSKILRERNMTLSELLEHRERGSSHVHLADIFHNASREPNPPEPFLSKSLIEPISKETYPLRALLDANLHDPPTKATPVESILTNHVNIPVIMDFGNNVNENAENMGIMSLFNNFTKNSAIVNEEISTIQKDSKGTPYKSTIIAVNTTDNDDTTRESRMLDDDQDDMISWNEIFTMIRKNNNNETKEIEKITNEISPSETYKKITLEEDVDGDGVIVLEDLQHFKDLGNNNIPGSGEKIEFNSLETADNILEPGILTKPPNSAKSVTVATASIVGLAMILFLLTYAALKWRQQRTMSHKKTFCDDRIPSPVFENRKITKNCSSRSISPMLPTSNIYTMSTLDSQNGKESPEYMWDTLRKPFQ